MKLHIIRDWVWEQHLSTWPETFDSRLYFLIARVFATLEGCFAHLRRCPQQIQLTWHTLLTPHFYVQFSRRPTPCACSAPGNEHRSEESYIQKLKSWGNMQTRWLLNSSSPQQKKGGKQSAAAAAFRMAASTSSRASKSIPWDSSLI